VKDKQTSAMQMGNTSREPSLHLPSSEDGDDNAGSAHQGLGGGGRDEETSSGGRGTLEAFRILLFLYLPELGNHLAQARHVADIALSALF
jgi:hypothetical protein